MRRSRIAGWLALVSCQVVLCSPASCEQALARDAWRSSTLAGEPPNAPSGVAPPKRIPYVSAPKPGPRGQPVATASIPKVVRLAVVADAARRFQVAESAVVLARAEAVTWSDGSMGCSPPGIHAQAPVPGYRITASTAAGQLVYHTDRHGHVVTCSAPAGPNY